MNKPRAALVLVLVAAGCDSVNSDNIQLWKTTQKGPAKLESALRDSATSPKLRAEAAAALVDIEMPEKVDEALAGIPASERWELLKSLIPLHIAAMGNPEFAKARDARDALFGLRAYAPAEEQKRIDAALLPVLEKEIRAGRTAGGRHSIEKILATMGPVAGPMLARLLEEPHVPFAAVAALLVAVGDDAARERGGAALVKRAAASPDIPVALWRALGTLGGKQAVQFLMQKVAQGWDKDAVAAAQALQQRREPAVLGFALNLAADTKANKAVRDEMFGVLEKIGGPEVQEGLIKVIASDPEELVRYRAYEAALAVGKSDAVLPALEALPAKATYKREDVADYLVKDITKLGAKTAHPSVLKALGSSSSLARMAAILSLEGLGSSADAPAVLRLAGDRSTVKGFKAGETVGREASRVAAALKSKPDGT